MSNRKNDHIELAFQSQTSRDTLDNRFYYEPLLSGHPTEGLNPLTFLGKTFRAPLWVSSMTGGTDSALKINQNLARACNEFGFGMGLGSCRSILSDNEHFADFDMRNIIGDDLPLFANLGISQIEQLVGNNKTTEIEELVKRLRADGLIVHVNPLQEWFQPEGDIIKHPPINTIKRLLDKVHFPVIVKEVGQGMGPASLRELLKLPLEAVEFAAFGGTNFAAIERLRDQKSDIHLLEPFSKIGMDAYEMLEFVNQIVDRECEIQCKQLIISGGINSYLDGYYLLQKSQLHAIYGQAWAFLKYAREDYEQLRQYVAAQVKGLAMAYAYLRIKS
ncbi:MAG: isopentenyl-diphosphate delta-isomerase [Bacteroidota bacterium]|nr:isopentenyl-diphosphate delta-isomerase [Bacteroidota bacterium]